MTVPTIALGCTPALREILNHLWQSSLFAIPVAVLAFALRSHQARIRHGLWLVASVKFLVPLSFLMVLGGHLPWPARAATSLTTAHVAINTLEPFKGDTSFEYESPILTQPQRWALSLESLLLLLWFCGFLLTAAYWGLQFERIRCLTKSAKPMLEGREVVALRRLESALGLGDRPIAILATYGSMEPGVFGILRLPFFGRRRSRLISMTNISMRSLRTNFFMFVAEIISHRQST